MSRKKDVLVRVDQDRFDQVAGVLIEALRNKTHPYDIAKRPQDMVPADIRADQKTHALLLFGVCYFMRGTIQSDFAIRQIVWLFRRHPEIFDPDFLNKGDFEEKVKHVHACLKGHIKYRLFEIPPLWVDGFRRLKEDWDGDPRKIFDGVHNSGELYRRLVNINSLRKKDRKPDKLRGFVGVRAKIANMLAYFFEDAAVIPEGQVKTSSPFDFHNGRAFISTRAIVLEGEGPFRFEDVTDIGSAAVEEYGIRHGVSMRVMADAFWLLSTTHCRRAPGNKTIGRDRHLNKHEGERHELGYRPRKRQQQKLELYVPDWAKQGDVHRHDLTCGRCPLSKLCELNVAAGFFYERGEFVTQPRTVPANLFGDGMLPYHMAEKRAVDADGAGEVGESEPLPVLTGLDISHIQHRPKRELESGA